MNIDIQVIENSQHRPGISGADWFYTKEGDLKVRVSKMSDWRYEVCLALHEVVEAILCKYNGIAYTVVDEFDRPYEEAKDDVTNTGDITNCPYRKEHCLATAAERIVAAELDVPWKEYDDELSRI